MTGSREEVTFKQQSTSFIALPLIQGALIETFLRS